MLVILRSHCAHYDVNVMVFLLSNLAYITGHPDQSRLSFHHDSLGNNLYWLYMPGYKETGFSGDVLSYMANLIGLFHDDVIKWKHFPCHWPFVRGLPVNSPHKGQWRTALMFSLICSWTHSWVNNPYTGDLRRHCTHYDVIVMSDFRVIKQDGPGIGEDAVWLPPPLWKPDMSLLHTEILYPHIQQP